MWALLFHAVNATVFLPCAEPVLDASADSNMITAVLDRRELSEGDGTEQEQLWYKADKAKCHEKGTKQGL